MNPLKLAIVGGGPSAFYVASRLLNLLPASSIHGANMRIHMYDRSWAPHGLVRYGVAPDHPEVKNCTHKFDEAATDPRLSFFGNVSITSSQSQNSIPTSSQPTLTQPLTTLFQNYTHLLLATGAPTPVLHSSLPPSTHCIPALSLVHWYTAHPSYTSSFTTATSSSHPLPVPSLDKISHVTLIGQGNVALDVARILLTPVSILSKYDIRSSVLDVLATSAVKHVSIVGRRGPYEAAFTTKELREMINLTEASMVPIEPDLLNPSEGKVVTRQQGRMVDLLKKGSKNKFGTTAKTWSLDFFRSPLGLEVPIASSVLPQIKAVLTLGHNTLDPVTSRAIPTSQTSTLETDLVVTSLGFCSEPSAPYYDPALGHLRNVGGRVVSISPAEGTGYGSEGGRVLKNVYASGWAANGAKGVLASTMLNAYTVADTILSDYFAAAPPASSDPTPVQATSIPSSPPSPEELVTEEVMNCSPNPSDPPTVVTEAVKDGRVLTYGDWKKIDQEEIRRGEENGKERERMNWEEVCAFLRRVVG
ncbi:hypothetical protein JAAARDRAFT_35002 [Jaapia argillacea MUCL 33604]|uniref:NADPH:adrenodoxin oxidoreductase, mitochondrial n=1 Tax=Jaapia argillacea MUCL 33604 TaxID=933084 RepID=A0A067Q3W3_9AGAM|nr:hypothetical protein JAAARDRAFT_35002 [Jaapia argillacea MUCL 33604]